jgi:uncharacterized Tic20 family protein
MASENETTQEERLLASLAHASILLNMMGPVAGILIYITQKEKSAYVARQALQATLYQLAGVLGIIVLWVCWGAFYAVSLIPLIAEADKYNDAPPPIFWVGLGSMICPLLLMGVWGLYGLYGGVRAWMGHDFRYALIGQMVEGRLAKEESDDK